MAGPKDKNEEEDEEIFISADGRIFPTASQAIEASLMFESVSNTGAGCSQSSDNVDDSKETEEPEDTYNSDDSDEPE